MEKSWNLTNESLILINWRSYAAVFQIPANVYVDQEVMEFYDTVMEKSWNFVAKISWQPCKEYMSVFVYSILFKCIEATTDFQFSAL